MLKLYPYFLLCFLLPACASGTTGSKTSSGATEDSRPRGRPAHSYDTTARVIHVMVALCDNKYQGIVPVPEKIGNGQDPGHNLYWGCAFGIRPFFSRSAGWQLLRVSQPGDTVLERLVFRHRQTGWYLVADAFDGRYIRQCTEHFLERCAGNEGDTLHVGGKVIGTGGYARLLAYTGHDGLMDFSLERSFRPADERARDAIILACYSRRFFGDLIRQTGANPLLWSTGLMSPEAYTLHDALDAYMKGQPPAVVRQQAAAAYSRYQKCSHKAAMGLLVTGH